MQQAYLPQQLLGGQLASLDIKQGARLSIQVVGPAKICEDIRCGRTNTKRSDPASALQRASNAVTAALNSPVGPGQNALTVALAVLSNTLSIV